MDRQLIRWWMTVAVAAGWSGALIAPASATASPDPGTALTSPSGEAASPEMLAAMQRDLQLTADQARARLAIEDVAMHTTGKLARQLGSSFAGAWLTDDLDLVVATTDPADAARVRTLGATPRVVAHSQRQLDHVKSALDRAPTPDPDQVTGWYVDVQDNTVVVQARPGEQAAARAFVRSSAVEAAAVRVETTTDRPRPLFDVRGGDAYFPGNSRCSIGFSVTSGFVTAGHCGDVGTQTDGFNGAAQGVVQGSSFPGNDYGWVVVNSNWDPRPLVNRYSGGQTVTVAGAQEAPVGASVCRSGSTTGWHCGTILAKNQTVNYPQGTVFGLTRTNVCAEPGDSGGSWLSGQQAQGVTSGGSGNCTSGGIIFFQPVQEILAAFDLTLVTSGGGGEPPPPPPEGCDDFDNLFTGNMSGTGDIDVEPNGSYFFWDTPGLHEGCLSGPAGTDFDLYLQQWNGFQWVTVAASTSPDSEETLSFVGGAAYYRYLVHSFSGSGNYEVGINVP